MEDIILSVANSGFDNWLDGYKLGAPDRKTSIYPDAALVYAYGRFGNYTKYRRKRKFTFCYERVI